MASEVARAASRPATVDDVQALMLAAMAVGARQGTPVGGGAGPGGMATRTVDPEISSLLPDWRNWLIHSKKASPRHVANRIAQVERVAGDLGLRRPSEINSVAVLRWFDKYAVQQRPRRGFKSLSAQTMNHYRTSLKAFLAWCRKKRGLVVDPLDDVTPWDSESDQRHPRREITVEEFAKLVAAAEAGGKIETLSGLARAVLYVVAAFTGFRKKELGSLRPESFSLATDPPFVRVEARFAKSRRERTVPLNAAVAEIVRRWLASRVEQTPLLWPIHGDIPGGRTRKTHRMIAKDLAAAGLAYRSALGFADLHACRHTFVSALARTGAHPRVTQKLAGHHDPAITMNVYTRVAAGELAAAVRSLPPPPAMALMNHPPEAVHGSQSEAGVRTSGGGAVAS